MSWFDVVLRTIAGAPDDVANLAEKLAITPAMCELAITALAKAHQQGGDTLALAAEDCGIEPEVLAEVVRHVGGEGSLTRFAAMLDQGSVGEGL